MKRLSSRSTTLLAVFASLHVVLHLMSFGLWRSWAIYIQPLEGIILGPWVGFLAALVGSVAARAIKPTDFWMFGITAEPMGVLACGLLARKQWKPLIVVYAVMLAAYFIHPFGRWLPLWTILDILLAFALVYPATKILKSPFDADAKRLHLSVPLISFIGSVTDALTRVFLLIPAGLYTLFAMTPEVVYLTFVGGAVDSYVEDVLVIAVSYVVGVPLLTALRKIPGFKYPLT